jgi:hypothetical protein
MGQILAASALIMGASYATEWFSAWYGGRAIDRSVVAFMFTGPYAPLYFAMLLFNVVLPQVFWFPAAGRSVLLLYVVSILIKVGMWLERILIIWMTLSNDYMPSLHRLFYMTAADWLFLLGPLAVSPSYLLSSSVFCPPYPSTKFRSFGARRRRHEEARRDLPYA